MNHRSTLRTTTLVFVIESISLMSTCVMLYFLHQSHLLNTSTFLAATFFTVLIQAILFIFRHHIVSLILQIIIIVTSSILSLLLFKYNDYFSKISSNETYYEKYSLVALKDSDLAKNNSGTITPLGLLTSDPYFDTVKQYLVSASQNTVNQNNTDQKNSDNKTFDQTKSRPDLLKTPLEETSLKTYDNLLALTTALTTPKSANDKLQTIFLGHTYLDALKDNNEAIYNQLQILADV